MAEEDMLSEDEIEALLEEEGEAESSAGSGEDDVALFSAYERIAESLGNTFGTILTMDVSVELESCQVTEPDGLSEQIDQHDRWVSIESELSGDLDGRSQYLLNENAALVMADIMMGQDGTNPPDELDESYEAALREMFNQVVNTTVNELADRADADIDLEPIESEVQESDELMESLGGDPLVQIVYRVEAGDVISDGILLELQPARLHELLTEAAEQEAAKAAREAEEEQQAEQRSAETETSVPGGAGADTGKVEGEGKGQKDVTSVDFPQFEATQGEEPVGNMNLLIDVPMEVSVELGRTTLQVKEILNLSQGSIIELERLAGEPVDLLVNGRLVARGEVVVIDENFGVRVTAIVDAMERIQ